VIDNTARVLAIELMCAVEGVGHRAPLRPGSGTAAVAGAVRELVPPLDADRPVGVDAEAVAGWIEAGGLDAVVAPWTQPG
jgi:histidine ammonia-lyase